MIRRFLAIAKKFLTAEPTSQKEIMLKAMALRAEPRARAPKRRLHRGPCQTIGVVEHTLPPRDGVRRKMRVPLKYQPFVDTSRYPGMQLRALRADGRHR